MAEAWVVEELEAADLGDKRLNDRLVEVLDGLAKHPNASIPAACNGYAETVGAYRFFDNEKATFDSVLEPHRKQTRVRMAAQAVVIVAQDTTEVDLTRPEQQVVGAGPLDGGARFGALLHELHAFTPDGTPLGTVDALPWMRDHEPTEPLSERQKEKQRKKTPIEEKESWRWVETLNKCREVSREMPPVTLNAVLVRELNPPNGEEPVEWILLTSLSVADAEQVRLVVQYYCIRWMIEVLFRTLKSGCRVEERLFEHVDRLLPCLAAYLIVAWRILYVCRLGRSCPDISCEAVFEPAEWKAVYHVVRREPPPSNPPLLSEMIRMVAQLGGYVNRKRPDPPGAQTVWLGMQRAHDLTECWLLFGPGAASGGDV